MKSYDNPSLVASLAVGGLTLFAVSTTATAMYRYHAQKIKLDKFIWTMKTLSMGTLQEHYNVNFSTLQQEARLSHWSFTALGGALNKVYKVTDISTENNEDLAIFRSVNNDESLECINKLEKLGYGHFVAKQYKLIPLFYENPKRGIIGSYLSISEYLPKGNLEQQALKFNDSDLDRQKKSLYYLMNIIELLSALDNANVYFPDFKPSNLFLNSTDQIILSDTKSLAFFKNEERNNCNKGLMLTTGYLPPELINNDRQRSDCAFDLDTLQSYQVGLSLYEFLTGAFISNKDRSSNNEHQFNFDLAVFRYHFGELLRRIILDLTSIDVKKRLKICEVINKYHLKSSDFSIKNKYDYESFFEEYNNVLALCNKSRLQVTIGICQLKDNLVQDNNRRIYSKVSHRQIISKELDDIMDRIRDKISVYHGVKNKLAKLAEQYQSQYKEDQILYWSCHVSRQESIKIVDALDYLCDAFFAKQKNIHLLSDLYQAFHLPLGRELLLQTVALLQQQNQTIHVIEGRTIHVDYQVANEEDTKLLSATYHVDIKHNQFISIHDFDQQLNATKKKGDPAYLQKIILQYPLNYWSIGIADTVNKQNKHDYYLMDSCITLLHEIGHVHALLTGEFVVKKYWDVLPDNLKHYHEVEEYLNIEKREYAEAKMDPAGFKRIGHTGFEFTAKDLFNTNQLIDNLLNPSILQAREKMVENYRLSKSTEPSILQLNVNSSLRL